MDPSFSDHIWSLEAMTTDKRILIPIYEMSAKEIKGYIKCFDVNVQTWVIIIRADQVQGALKSQLQHHGSCLHRLDKGAKISLRKGCGKQANEPKSRPSSHTKFGRANLSKVKEPLSRLQILSPISGGRLIELTPRNAYNDIWTRSQVVSTLGKVIRW